MFLRGIGDYNLSCDGGKTRYFFQNIFVEINFATSLLRFLFCGNVN